MPVDSVADALRREGLPLHDVWLDFHVRFAGYEEPMGYERAIWGIVHVDPQWQDPHEVWFTRRGDRCAVACADVHPSFDYRLDSRGEFSGIGGGGPCESFPVHVEQLAAVWETAACSGRRWTTGWELMRDRARREKLRERLGGQPIVEASDRYSTHWRAADIIVRECEKSAFVWIAGDPATGCRRAD